MGMNGARDQNSPCCHLFFGEWQAVRPVCLKVLEAIFPDLPEKDITMLHGDDVTESRVLESLKTRDLFSSRTAVVYREPDFLQPKGKKEELSKRLEKALRSGGKDRAARIISEILREKKISIADLKTRREDVVKALGLPDTATVEALWGIVEEFESELDRLDEPPVSSGEKILEWISRLSEGKRSGDVFLVIQMEEPDRKNAVLRRLMKACPVTDLTGAGEKYAKRSSSLQAQVKGWLADSGKRIDAPAMKSFMEKVGETSLSALRNETEKLVSLSGQRKIISLEDVERLVVRHREEEIFRVTDAFRNRDVSRALISLRLLLDQGIHPLAVLSAVRNVLLKIFALKAAADTAGLEEQIRNISYNMFKNRYWNQLKSAFDQHEKNPLAGLHPYAAWLNMHGIHRFSWREIFGMLEEMADMDIALKGGKISPDIVLEAFFMRNL